jgi:protein-tyrosine phosphatase
MRRHGHGADVSRLSRLNRLLQRLRLRRTELERYGAVDWSRVRRLHFVCKGNICRSAFGDALARSHALAATSSGVHAGDGGPADAVATRIAEARGVMLGDHRTTPFRAADIAAGDLLVAMEPWHARAIAERAASVGAQVTLLGLWAPLPDAFVDDPYGRDDAAFHQCFAIIEVALDRMCRAWRAGSARVLPDHRQTASMRRGRRPLKTLLGTALFATGAHRLFLRRRAVVVAFHSITPGTDGDGLRTPIAAFAAFCAFFRRHFEIVTLHELVRRLQAREPIDGLLAITFDDGYRDNLDLAEPVLRQLGLPATFFVTTGYVGTNAQASWDQARGLQSAWLDWPQVLALHRRGHCIASHTVQHVRVDQVAVDALGEELVQSARCIEAVTHARPDLFAVPFGRPESLTPAVRAQAQAAGYRAVFTAVGGVITPDSELHGLNRFPIPYGDVLSSQELGFDMLRECLTIDRAAHPREAWS